MDAAHDRRRHLGEILVEEGFISPDALAGALERQSATERPLGEVVVELGLVSPGAVANALAEQYGGVLRTEYGISAGFRPTVVEADGPEDVPAEAAPDVLDAWRAALAERDRLLLELSDAVRSRDAEIAKLRADLAARSSEIDERTAELEDLALRLAEAEAERAPEEPAVEAAHVLMVPTPEGYELLDREGPTPLRGTVVDLEAAYVVSSVGAAPLPGSVRCAFLERV